MSLSILKSEKFLSPAGNWKILSRPTKSAA
jgi:hypothetical protein